MRKRPQKVRNSGLGLGLLLAVTGWGADHRVSNLGPLPLSAQTSGLVNACLIAGNVSGRKPPPLKVAV
jgi:hypothetical protein